MKKLHKKGITVEAILKVILMAVFIGILFFIFYQIYGVVTSGSEKQLCLLSGVLETNTASALAGFKWECPINKLDIEKKDISKKIETDVVMKRRYGESKDSRLQQYYKNLITAEQKDETATQKFRLNQKIARELQDCWEKTGQGEFDLGGRWDNPFSEGKIYCAICTRIKFNDIPVLESGTTLTEYLMFTPHPNPEMKSKYTGTRISLYEFLLDDNALAPFFPSFNYDTSKDYAVVYMRSNEHGLIQTVGEVSEPVANMLRTVFNLFERAGSFLDKTEKEKEMIAADPSKDKNYAVDAILILPLVEVKDKCTDLINYG